MDWLLRSYTATTPLAQSRIASEEGSHSAQLLQPQSTRSGSALGNIAGTANDALHAGALELARLGAVGDLLWCVIGAQPLMGEVAAIRCVVLRYPGGIASSSCFTPRRVGLPGSAPVSFSARAALTVEQYDLRKFAVNTLHEGFGGHLRQKCASLLHHSLLGDDVVLWSRRLPGSRYR